jgi:hypothetical protein
LTKSISFFVRKSKKLLVVLAIVLALNLFFISYARAEDPAPAITTIVTPGGDDVSYQIPLTVSVVYDGVTYENVYATTNSVITFGRPDGTYWTYPTTPSVSIESKDWWVLPQQMPDTHFIINVSEGGFQVDGNYRPYGTFTGDTTSIVITAQIQTDGTVAYSYAVNGPLAGNERTGAVLTDGTVVPLEEVNIIQVEVPPVLEPTPVEPEPTPPPVEPEPTPPPVVEPIPDTTVPTVPDTVVVEPPIIIPIPPEPPLVEEIVPEEPPVPVEEPPAIAEEPPTELEPPVEAEPAPEEAEEPPVEEEAPPVEAEEPPAEVIQADEIDLETLAPETPVELENGVVLEAGTVVALQLLENPAELLAEIFTDPEQVLTALSNIGADMSEEEREESEKVIIASVIAGQAAVGAATMAAGSTTRTPSAPSAPAGGPAAGNDKPRASRRRES